ncbi:MAG: hypothetical protein AAFX54_07840, partial [Pseudomonadota bacterium]
MTTFSIVDDASVGSSGVSGGTIANVKSTILAAAEMWNRYFSQGSFDIKIELAFVDLGGTTLATGGAGLTFFGSEGPGLEVWKVDSLEEYIVGGEIEASEKDITITIDTTTLLDGKFFFDPAPFSRTAEVPFGQFDFFSVVLHELAHGFGFLSISADGMDTVDDTDPMSFIDITPFDLWVDPDAPGGRSFVGPAATAAFGGNILLDSGSDSHTADPSEGGVSGLMNPTLMNGTRSFISPVLVAMFEDIGMPIRKATNGSDELFGFDALGDVFNLLAGDDTVDSGSGNDFIDGGDGNDFIIAGSGRDTVMGGVGDDRIDAGTQSDVVDAGANSDGVFGGAGNDTLLGNNGNDTLSGARGKDVLEGGKGFDFLLGGDDGDRLTGGALDDTLVGGAGNDNLDGGDGDDRILGGSGRDMIAGGSGDDLVDAAAGADIISGGTGRDDMFGGTGADVMSGQGGNDTLSGGADNDTITGGSGFDVLLGGDGDDVLEGGNLNDILLGNGGNDTFVFSPGD